jgi:protocatechuate 3,4-dioxygenase beta subunit
MNLALMALAASSVLNLAPAQEPGVPLHIFGVVQDRDGDGVAGAALHIYQTDAEGRYTLEKPMDEPHARLSGRLTTDERGRFEIRTIRPGGYPHSIQAGGRDRHIPAHIHIDVTAAGHPERRVQVVFADDPPLRDPYWQDWVKRLEQPVATLEPEADGFAAHIALTVE